MTIRCLPLAATASVLVLSLTSANADTFNKNEVTSSAPFRRPGSGTPLSAC